MKPILETPRLLLREMSRDDIGFIAELLGSPRVMRWYPKVLDRDESLAWIDRQVDRYTKYGHGFWLAVERATGEPIGQIGATMCEVDGADERALGWIVHEKHWRRGFASEGAAAVRDWCFPNFDRDYAFTVIRPENVPSAAVARTIGMTLARRTTYAGLVHDVWIQAARLRVSVKNFRSGPVLVQGLQEARTFALWRAALLHARPAVEGKRDAVHFDS